MTRSTIDLVILGITAIIAFVIVASLIGIIAIELIHPETDTDPLVRMESEILGVLVGALVGFIGGRQVGRGEWTGDTSSLASSSSPSSSYADSRVDDPGQST